MITPSRARPFWWITAFLFTVSACAAHGAKRAAPSFNVIGFFTGKKDNAHISFLHEAVVWFPEQAGRNGFHFDTTSNWANLNDDFLRRYQVVVFLDTRPEDPAQRAAFQRYMERGGGWMGFHFAGFALDHSVYPANWSWYHDSFLGAGSYVSNTWRPTSAEAPTPSYLPRYTCSGHANVLLAAGPAQW